VPQKLVAFHSTLSASLQQVDETRAPYAVLSIRDLLQVVMHVNLDREEMKRGPVLAHGENQHDYLTEQICFQVWTTYACRFRSSKSGSARDLIEQLITKEVAQGRPTPRLQKLIGVLSSATEAPERGPSISVSGVPGAPYTSIVKFDSWVRLPCKVDSGLADTIEDSLRDNPHLKHLSAQIAGAHRAVQQLLCSRENIDMWGIHLSSQLWW
jgi:hypothetical protein